MKGTIYRGLLLYAVMKDEMDQLRKAMQRAGKSVLQSITNDLNTKCKANGDLVTRIDFEVNRILKECLMKNFPEDGWLSEETLDSRDRLKKKRVWIVDPIDGTKELVGGIPEFAISVALVQDQRPVMAAVYNPITDELFTASRGEGIWLNGEPSRSGRLVGERLVILASRSEFKNGKFKPFERYAEVRPVGSIAYKLALVATGKADATFSLGPKNEWDIAAGVLLVEESGGRTADREGISFLFNRANTLVNGIVAARADAYAKVETLIKGRGRGQIFC